MTERMKINYQRLAFNVTEDILLAMQDEGISHLELSKKINKPESYLHKLLNGEEVITLHVLNDICDALSHNLELKIIKNGIDVSLPV